MKGCNEKFQLDKGEILRNTLEQYNACRSTYNQLTLIKCYVRSQKHKFQNVRQTQKNQLVDEMAQYNIHDQVFQEQIKNAKPQTKEFINSILSNYEQEEIQRFQIEEEKKKKQEQMNEQGKKVVGKIVECEQEEQEIVIPKRKETSEFLTIMPKRRDTLEEFPLPSLKQIQDQQSKLSRQGERLKGELRQNLRKIIGDQMKLDDHEWEEQMPNLNLTDLFINKNDSLEKCQELKSTLEEAIVEEMKFTEKIKMTPAVYKFRKIVEKHLMTKTLEDIEKLNRNKVDITLVSKMAQFCECLKVMFPKNVQENNIGYKLDMIGKNIFLNEYYYGILAEIPSQIDQEIMRDHFALRHQNEKEICKSPHCTVHSTLERKINLNSLFNEQIDKELFFQQIKNLTLIQKDANFCQKQAITKYYEIQQQNKQIAKPSFLSIQRNLLFLSNRRITKEHAIALSKYLELTRELHGQRIYRLVIESCSMSDEAFEHILRGIKQQCINDVISGRVKNQYLQTLIYSNNVIGLKSIEVLGQLLPRIVELVLNNLEFQWDQQVKGHDMIKMILETITTIGTKLMKLKLSKMDLNNEEIVKLLVDTISYNKNMIALDLSYCELNPQQLCQIMEALSIKAKCMRNLNLSYNQLDFNEDHEENLAYSEEFMKFFKNFSQESLFINHINFSHMGFGKAQISQLLDIFKNCQFLLSIHLNDNGINDDKEFFSECCENFYITELDLLEINRSKESEAKIKPQRPADKFYIDYKKELKKYFNLSVPKQTQEYEGDHIQTAQIRKLYKDHFLLCQEYKIVEQCRSINRTRIYYGSGRQKDNIFDRFILTRKLNHPELVFNQRVRDDGKKTRFFKRDADSEWKLSPKDECYVCNKHVYTMVFYERTAIMHQNKELVEITDPILLGKMKREFDIDYRRFNSKGPIISGSLVSKGVHQGPFDRKLKMIPASLFCLLQICHTREFSKSDFMTRVMKDGVIKYLQFQSNKLLEELELDRYLEGWETLMIDKCSKNELMDVRSINMPNLEDGPDNLDIYVYAGYFKPGYHQFLIYDPVLEKGFCKDIVLNLNLREDIFPEYPILEGAKIIRKVRNVWKPWLEDTEEDVTKAFNLDRDDTEDFYVFELIKNKEDAQKVLDILKENFDVVKIYQRHLQVASTKYPEISWENIWVHLDRINKTSKLLTRKEQLARAMCELCFIRATRNQTTQGLQGAMQRCELFEMIIRLSMQWIKLVWGYKELISGRLREFLNIYLVPIYTTSPIILERVAIRESKHLNQLLYDNRPHLQKLMDFLKGKDKNLTLCHCQSFFGYLCHPKVKIGSHLIEQSFIYSMMTIICESKDMKKYDHLYFVEFLEFLCRLAIGGVLQADTIEFKVFTFLEVIWQKLLSLNVFNGKDQPLAPIDENPFKCI